MAGKVIGIIALVLSIVAIILPGGALVASFVVAPLLVFAWKEGALFGYIAGGLNIINIIFLSPTMWIAAGVAEAAGEGGGSGLGLFYVGIQVVAMALLYFLNGRQTAQ